MLRFGWRTKKGGNMEGDLSAIVYVVILAILLSKVFGFGCGGGTCS